VREGDEPSELARNFCKLYSLNKQMQIDLTRHLQDHIDSYHAQLK
jgi:hypothetical protein